MKTVITSVLAAVVGVTAMQSCTPNDPTPPLPEKNNKVDIVNIKFPTLYTASDVYFYMHRNYTIVGSANDTTLRTVVDSFQVGNMNGFNQALYFDHPANSKLMKLRFSAKVWNGTTTNLTVQRMSFIEKGQTKIADEPMYMDKINNSSTLQEWTSASWTHTIQ